jgi:5-hydroxyisourate hydrolase
MPARSSISAQLTSIKNNLSSSSAPQLDIKSTMSERPPITCHVLDTTIGLPAPDISVILRPAGIDGTQSSPTNAYKGITNDDGRVTEWVAPAGFLGLTDVFGGESRDLMWILEFDTGAYWEAKGIKPFFPKVSLQFATQSFKAAEKGEQAHWHVPLLLGPYNYTTYRGS